MFTNSHLEAPLSFPDICLAGQLTLYLIDENIISALALVQAFPVWKLGGAVAIAGTICPITVLDPLYDLSS